MKHKKIIITASVLIVVLVSFVCLEYYAHTYVQLANLPVSSSEESLNNQLGKIGIINDTLIFSSNGAQWLLLLQLGSFKFENNQHATAYLLIFKIQENTSSFVNGLDLVVEGIDTASAHVGSSHDEFCFYPTTYEFNGINCSQASQGYDIFDHDSNFNVDFALTLKVYESTLIGILPVNETMVHFNETYIVQ